MRILLDKVNSLEYSFLTVHIDGLDYTFEISHCQENS